MFAGYFIDLILGDPYGFPHPVIYIGKLVSRLEKAARKKAGSPAVMKAKGFFIWILTVAVTFAVAYMFTHLGDIIYRTAVKNGYAPDIRYFRTADFILAVFVMWTCYSTKCLADESKKIYGTLCENDIEKSRKQLSYIVGRDTSGLSESEIIRATVETVAENTVDGTMAPMFYAFIGSAPFAMVYKAVNTMDSMLGYKNEKYRDIGFFSAKLDDVFNYIPARMSVIFFTAASFLLGYDYRNCFRISIRDRKHHTSPNCAFPEGAVAGALGIQLGGENIYFGKKVYKPKIGDSLKEMEKEDILKANRLLYVSTFINLLFYAALTALI